MNIVKYLVVPGTVISRSDGDKHYISFNQLTRLYDVNPRECLNYDCFQVKHYTQEAINNFVVLEPRSDGNYTLQQK